MYLNSSDNFESSVSAYVIITLMMIIQTYLSDDVDGMDFVLRRHDYKKEQ